MTFYSIQNFINKNKIFANTLKFLIVVVAIISAHALYIVEAQASVSFEKLPDEKVFNDFAVGPGKIEMELSPGQTGTFDLMISNRLGTEKSFSLQIEDFKGSEDPNQTVVLLGSDRGPYSLKDYIKLGTTSVDLTHGTRVRVSVSVSVPVNAEPGGLYGTVVVGTESKSGGSENSGGVVSTNPVFTRIGALVFIRVKGDIKEDGKLSNFTLSQNKKIVSGTDTIIFNLFFKNDGNVHLNPKGTINIKNILGASVGDINVESWFAMPKSLRFREVSWKPKFLFGKYTAVASIDRGYGQMKDELTYTFWAVPWKILLILFAAIVVVVVLLRKMLKKKRRSGLS